MATKGGSQLSSVFTSFSSQSRPRSISSKVNLSLKLFGCQLDKPQRNFRVVSSCLIVPKMLKAKKGFAKRQCILSTSSEEVAQYSDVESDASDQEQDDNLTEEASSAYAEGGGGKPGLISFYNHPYKLEANVLKYSTNSNQSKVLWFVGPAVLVASFVFPSLYLRRILSTVFEDSLLTDFLILFFTEALFYCGAALFLFIIDHLQRPVEQKITTNNRNPPPEREYQITSVAVLVLSLVIPMVTMGLVWPWTGPAASATLAPYLVGIVVQFAFEQYARYVKSPSYPVVPVIFQVYRLHQLNRAAQLVTALSFTVRGAEMTTHNIAINSSLGTLLNVLQCLGVICIWSLSSFLMRFLPSAIITEQ
ncbi:uncharacterized protein LOC108223773 isoform X1 [Daucus carota subsp. sativus]|uniref:uncharacterized protein LOC108223773 isoform X1 n=1 Tax=Daucus carota subsp. sativus TaxID=79200 RepID=UPI0007F015AD|nr:PREDICTED: uncharacterized protein LOC108223773 isoform X1 [Daucus carota subsp. sativus]